MFDFEHVNTIRSAEVGRIAGHLPSGGRVLEIGAGSGQQALELTRLGFIVDAIEVPSTAYTSRVYPVAEYDGRNIPHPSQTFDAVFSSNVLEHVADLGGLNAEIGRVLKPGGKAVHVMPTHAWRFWTTALLPAAGIEAIWQLRRDVLPRRRLSKVELERLRTAWVKVAKACAPVRHGECGNILSELWLFRPQWWRRSFAENGFETVQDEPMGLFYTGTMTLGPKLSFESRQRLSRFLGSACHLFVVRPRRHSADVT